MHLVNLWFPIVSSLSSCMIIIFYFKVHQARMKVFENKIMVTPYKHRNKLNGSLSLFIGSTKSSYKSSDQEAEL